MVVSMVFTIISVAESRPTIISDADRCVTHIMEDPIIEIIDDLSTST